MSHNPSRADTAQPYAGVRTTERLLKFYGVGAVGICVQLGTLAVLTRIAGAHYLMATALAVEAAVLHNFWWHERLTWADRLGPSGRGRAFRLLRFNATTGLISIAGNVLLMRLLVGQAHLPVLAANLLTVALCSALNFLASDRLVFLPELRPRTPSECLKDCGG